VIALINIVFLMLIFFLVAGTVAAPLDPSLQLIVTDSLEGRAPPDALVLAADGGLSFRGAPTDVATYMSADGGAAVRIVPDRAAPARRLVEVTLALRAAGAERVLVVTARGLE
jgi:biopolymer transport protein ExbD